MAFLDQFIERSDVLNLRRRLVSDLETRHLLDALMPNNAPNEREVFDGMRGVFAAEAERSATTEYTTGPPNLIVPLSWTGWKWPETVSSVRCV